MNDSFLKWQLVLSQLEGRQEVAVGCVCSGSQSQTAHSRSLVANRDHVGVSVRNTRWPYPGRRRSQIFCFLTFGRMLTFSTCQPSLETLAVTISLGAFFSLTDVQWVHNPVAVVLVCICGISGVWILISCSINEDLCIEARSDRTLSI